MSALSAPLTISSAHSDALYQLHSDVHAQLRDIRATDPDALSDPHYLVLSALADNASAALNLLRVLSRAANLPV